MQWVQQEKQDGVCYDVQSSIKSKINVFRWEPGKGQAKEKVARDYYKKRYMGV